MQIFGRQIKSIMVFLKEAYSNIQPYANIILNVFVYFLASSLKHN